MGRVYVRVPADIHVPENVMKSAHLAQLKPPKLCVVDTLRKWSVPKIPERYLANSRAPVAVRMIIRVR